MRLHFETETGSHYEINDDKARRVNPDAGKRADNEWVRLHTMFPKHPNVGFGVVLILDSLSGHGPDDEGRVDSGSVYTTRRTSRVVRVWEGNE